jgi:hypothetical protein
MNTCVKGRLHLTWCNNAMANCQRDQIFNHQNSAGQFSKKKSTESVKSVMTALSRLLFFRYFFVALVRP